MAGKYVGTYKARNRWYWKTTMVDAQGNRRTICSKGGGFDTQEEAFSAKEREMEKIRGGKAKQEKYHTDTLGKFYLSDYVPERFPGLQGTTRSSQVSVWNKEILPRIGHKLLEDITREDLLKIRDEMRAAGWRDSYVDFARMYLNAALELAVEKERITKNPLRHYKIGLNIKARSVTPLTREQLLAFIEALEGRDKMFVAIMGMTGCRPGEALGLEWKDIDFERKTIFFHQQVDRVTGELKDRLKSGCSRRLIPILDDLLPLLEGWQKESAGKMYKDFVLQDGKAYMRAQELKGEQKIYHRRELRCAASFEPHWRTYIRPKCPNAPKGFTMKSLRHTFGTLAHRAGLRTIDIKNMVGHGSIQTTEKVYIHTDVQDLQRAVEGFSIKDG